MALLVGMAIHPVAIAASGKIPLATGDYPPYVVQEGPEPGVFVEILSAVFHEMHQEFTLVFVPWARAEALAKQGEVFATFPYRVTEERKHVFDFSSAVITDTGRFFGKRGGKVDPSFEWKKLSDLRPYVIGGVHGYWYESVFKNEGLTVVYSYSDENSFKSLSVGRVDLVPTSELVGWSLIQKLDAGQKAGYFALGTPLNQSDLCLMVSRNYAGSDQLLQSFNKALARIRAKGVYAAILNKYDLGKPGKGGP